EIKDLDASIGNHQRNVGEYGAALDNLPLGPAAKRFLAVASGEEVARKGAIALGKAFLRLALNPIVLTIITLGALFTTLYKAFQRTDDGGTRLAAMFSRVRAVVDV